MSTASSGTSATVTYAYAPLPPLPPPALEPDPLATQVAELKRTSDYLDACIEELEDSLDETDQMHDDLYDRVNALEARTLGPQAQSLASQVLACLERLAAVERGWDEIGDEIDGTDMLHDGLSQRVDAMARRIEALEQSATRKETAAVSEAEQRGYERGRRDDDAAERRGYERAIADVHEWMTWCRSKAVDGTVGARVWSDAVAMFDKHGPGGSSSDAE